MASSKSLYANGELLDIDDKTVIAISDNNQPFNNLFAITASKSNTFKLPATVNNCRIFESMQLPASGTTKRYERADIIYLQDEIELITNGIGYINKTTNDSFELVVYSRDVELFEAIKGKTLQDVNLSRYDYLHTSIEVYGKTVSGIRSSVRYGQLITFVKEQVQLIDEFQSQPRPMLLLLEKIGIFPMIDYDKDSTEVPMFEREMTISGALVGTNDVNGRFCSFLNEKHIFPAIYLKQIIFQMFIDAGFRAVIPNSLFSENVVIPFCNDTMQLKASFVLNRYAENMISGDFLNATLIKTFIPLTQTNTSVDECVSGGRYRYGHVSDNSYGYPIAQGVFFDGPRPIIINVDPVVPEIMEFELDIAVKYYGEFGGVLDNNKLLIVWENTANLAQFVVIKEYVLEQRTVPQIKIQGVLQSDFTGGGRLISEKFDTNNFFLANTYPACDSWQIAVYSNHIGYLVVDEASKINIKPKAKSKKIRNVIWGISENLPTISQADFLRSFLMFNGLEMTQNQTTKQFTFSKIDYKFYKDIVLGNSTPIDLTNKLDTSGGYYSKIIGSTFAKKNTFEYKKDSTVKSTTGSYTVEIPAIQTGKETQNVFTLPFASSDDSVPSKNIVNNGIDFGNGTITARLPYINREGVITGKVEPKLLHILQYDYGLGFGNSLIPPSVYDNYEPPLWLLYGVLPIGAYDDQFSDSYLYMARFFPIKMLSVVGNSYGAYERIIKTTTAYSAEFLLNAEDYITLNKNRVIQITKGDLEGLWYINKKTNFVDSTRTTELELQRLTNPTV